MDALYVGSSDVTRGRRGPFFLPVVVVLAALLVMALGAGSALAGHTERVSVNPQGDRDSFTNLLAHSNVSEDGRYLVFESDASNLVAGDTNAVPDVFVRDRVKGETRRVSVASDGTEGDRVSQCATISADGRYIAFHSSATNLVAFDGNDVLDVFVHDQWTGQTERVSVASGGTEAHDASGAPCLSENGRYVAFTSCATDLVAGDTNDLPDAFVHDRETKETTRVSVASDGTEGTGGLCAGSFPSISADGRYVAFYSEATTLVAGDTNGLADIFVHDRQTQETERVSVASDGAEGDGGSARPSLSADGRYIAFDSYASNLVLSDGNGKADIFVHDRQTRETERVSVDSHGDEGNEDSLLPSISADGRYVGFSSCAPVLVTGDTNGTPDAFVHDRQTRETERVSVDSGGTEGDLCSLLSFISAGGRYVVFESQATNLVDGDTNDRADVFLHDRETGETERVSVAECGTEGTLSSGDVTISADGRYVAFSSDAVNLVGGDMNVVPDAFVYDRLTDAIERVSVASDGTEGNNRVVCPSLSADGHHAAFTSCANNLVTGDANGKSDVFVHDRDTGETERVSVNSEGAESDDCSYRLSLSADGRYVAFSSCATNLVAGDTEGKSDVFVHDRETGQTERVSVASDGTEGNDCSGYPSISADGRYVAFASNCTNLVTDDTNSTFDVFVHDRQTGETVCVSVATDGTQGNDSSEYPSISGDGRYVAFASNSTNLVTGDTNTDWDIFVHDRQTGQTVRVSVASDGAEGDGDSDRPSLSADGRYVAFPSNSTNLVTGDTNTHWDIFVHDRVTGQTVRVSVASDGAEGNGNSYIPSMSADGRWIGFESEATNLVPGDTNGFGDIFVHERLAADFAGDPAGGDAPLTVQFTDLSSARPAAWEWDFGDGGTSTEQNPSHTYLLAGIYTPSMTATDAYESDTEIKTDYITVGVPGVAAFSATPTQGIMGMTVTFTDESTGDIDSWAWDFGDGGTSSEQNPSYTYLLAGIYTPSMTVSTAWGSDTETKNQYIWVGFLDCGPDNWAFEDTLLCVDADIVQGYPGGYYQPTWAVNRGQMAVYIARAIAGGDSAVPDASPPATFDDVSDTNSAWAWKYVEYAVAQNVVQGYDENTYAPEVEVDRGQMAVFIARGKGWVILGEDMTTAPELFPDVPAGFWAGTAVEACVDNGVVQGYGDGNYHPDDIVTRDQMSVYVARAFELAM